MSDTIAMRTGVLSAPSHDITGTAFDYPAYSSENKVGTSLESQFLGFPTCGPVAQLGARFHGMEEVVGSIPTRSTKSLNNLDRASARSYCVCVAVCVITRHFGAHGRGFHCCSLRFLSRPGSSTGK